MTDDDTSSVRTYPCPSPDDCPFPGGSAAELLEHVNSEHAGEYQRRDWPDTEAGREAREVVQVDEEDDVDEQREDDLDG